MANVHKCLEALPGLAAVGGRVYSAINKLMRSIPGCADECLRNLGQDTDAGPGEALTTRAREALGQVLGVQNLEPPPAGDPGPSTPVRSALLIAWAEQAQDPDVTAARWFEEGAPGGLDAALPPSGVFPPLLRPDEAVPKESLRFAEEAEAEAFVNYETIEGDDEAEVAEELEKHEQLSRLATFDDWPSLLSYLEDQRPVLSKLGLVVKVRAGKRKLRIILDAKSSSVSKAAVRHERMINPRVLDATNAAMAHLAHNHREERKGRRNWVDSGVEFLVIDVEGAFWLVPLAQADRRFFTFKFRGRYWVYLVTAQGSRTAPITWGRIAALLCRLTQGVFEPHLVRINMFVDDPILSLRGSQEVRRFHAAMFILLWRALDFPLQFAKARLGPSVEWIGATLSIHPLGLQASAKPDILDELSADLDWIEPTNVISKKDVRSLAGRSSHIATLVPAWRPFLAELWAALATDPAGAPPGCVWTRQIRPTTRWMRAFIAGRSGTVTRLFRLSAFMNLGTQLSIVTDASPWGLGGYLVKNGAIVEYFSDALSADDLERFHYDAGSSDGQQTWESLAALAALRCWASHWQEDRVRLRVRGDSVTMLTAMLQLKAATRSPLTLLARELALDVAESSFEPDLGSHLPGDANTLADVLSRRFAPGAAVWAVPAQLTAAAEVRLPARDRSFYRTIDPPY